MHIFLLSITLRIKLTVILNNSKSDRNINPSIFHSMTSYLHDIDAFIVLVRLSAGRATTQVVVCLINYTPGDGMHLICVFCGSSYALYTN